MMDGFSNVRSERPKIRSLVTTGKEMGTDNQITRRSVSDISTGSELNVPRTFMGGLATASDGTDEMGTAGTGAFSPSFQGHGQRHRHHRLDSTHHHHMERHLSTPLATNRSGTYEVSSHDDIASHTPDTVVPFNEVFFRGVTSVGHGGPLGGSSVSSNRSYVFAGGDNTTFYHNVPYTFSNSTAGVGNSSHDGLALPAAGGLPAEEQTVLVILYTLTTLLAVSGNVIVILVFTFGKRSRTDLRVFLINLAFADLIMAIFCMPFTFTMTMLGNWIFSAPMCPIVLYMQTVSVTASVCTNMAIGIDRFWVVSFPLKSRITKSRSRMVIGIVWIIAFGLSSVQLIVGRIRMVDPSGESDVSMCEENWPSEIWRRVYTFFILILTYLMPLTILSLTYGIVATKLWQRTTPGNADQARDSHQLRSKRKVIKMLSVVVALFGICWLPLHVFFLVLDFAPSVTQAMTPAKERFLNALYYGVHWLAMSNSFVNPIIYGFLNDSFRNDLKRLWRRWFPCCRCLPCLATGLSRESTIAVKEYSRCDRQNSSSGSGTVRPADSSKKLLSVKMNGVGKCETGLSCKDSLLRPSVQRSSKSIDV